MIKRCLLLLIFVMFLSVTALADTKRATGPLQLAQQYEEGTDLTDYLISEKLDGVRARWTGTQLLTRNGNLIHTPDWFTRDWPAEALDGELWTTRKAFQRIVSIVLSDSPDERWREVRMMVFDLPAQPLPFAERVTLMEALVRDTDNPSLAVIPQFTVTNEAAFNRKLTEVTNKGGEGLMLHHRQAMYQHGRSGWLLKAKRFQDDEAKVIAHLPGKGKYLGMMGSLLVEGRNGLQFKIGSGFTDILRRNPPEPGSWVTFKYYGKTKKGIPRFASFLHERPKADRPQ